MKGDQKGVVYYRSKNKYKAFVEKLGYDFYYNGVEEGER